MRKKLTWIFLVLVLVLCVKPMRVKAADEDYRYGVDKDGACIYEYIGKDTDVVIPEYIGGSPVTCITDGAFSNCKSVRSVTIPSTVKDIRVGLFENNPNLESIKVSGKNKVYDSRDNCNAIIETKTNKLIVACRNTKIPRNVTSIGYGAFSGCIGLKKIYIPANVVNIEWGAIANCKDLQKIEIAKNNKVYDSRNNCNAIIETKTNKLIAGCGNTIIPNSVLEIEGWAFGGCSSLKSIKIPQSVTVIGSWAFVGCGNLQSISIPEGVTVIGSYTFLACEKLSKINIPSSVVTIGSGAFSNCESLESIKIPSGVTEIASYTFEYCKSLKSIAIPSSVKIIGNNAFDSCTELTNIQIPNDVTDIYWGAFNNCVSLTSIYIPEKVERIIGGNILENCPDLVSIKVSENNTVYDSRENCNALIDTATNALIVGCKNTVIPASVAIICNDAFLGCSKLKKIDIPAKTTGIWGNPFSNCSSLESINVEAGNKIYDSRENCNAIIEKETNTLISGCKNTKIPSSVEKIANRAFQGCTELENISVPENVKEIGEFAFRQCSKLKKIDIPYGIEKIEAFTFEECTSLENISIPDSVTYIKNTAFARCTSLKKVNIPSSVVKIDSWAFYRCTGLKNVKLPAGLETLNPDVFEECTSLETVTIVDDNASINDLNNASLSWNSKSKMKKIDDNAFKGCINLKKINIPTSVTGIGEEAFSGCKSLKKIEIPASVKKIGKDAFKNCNVTIRCKYNSAIYKYAVKNKIPYELTDVVKKGMTMSQKNIKYIVTSVKASNRTVAVTGIVNKKTSSVKIPAMIKIYEKTYKVTAVADRAFKNNKKLTKVTIGKNVKKIGNSAFANCTKLTAITLGGQVQTIGKSAFSGCAKLAKLTLGKKVKTIGSKAFYGCKKLTKITIQTSKLTTKSVGSKAFTGVSKKAKVYLPKKNAKAYKKLLKSKGLSTKVKYQNIK